MGFSRNLEVHEIAGPGARDAAHGPARSGHEHRVHGMGEPLMNWKAVGPTLTLLNSPDALGIGARHITDLDRGVLPGIVALGERPSSSAGDLDPRADDDLRQRAHADQHQVSAGRGDRRRARFDRRVTFEYVMLGGVNDRPGARAGARRPRARLWARS
jgi:23S rRNA (adenine2503-C2)-methyltransferase